MKLSERVFPLADNDAIANGWVLDTEFLRKTQQEVENRGNPTALEAIEEVLLVVRTRLADEIESLERQRDALLDAGKYLIETMNAGDGLGEAIDMIEAAIKSVEQSHE